jgi:hypothetical protein
LDFAICLADDGYDDLEAWKVYRVLPDAKAAGVGCIRVIDNSGEDYLYPAERFVPVDIPKNIRARLLKPKSAASKIHATPASSRA